MFLFCKVRTKHNGPEDISQVLLKRQHCVNTIRSIEQDSHPSPEHLCVFVFTFKRLFYPASSVHPVSVLIPLEPQSRFGDKLLEV